MTAASWICEAVSVVSSAQKAVFIFLSKLSLSLKDSVFGVSTAVMLTEIFIYFPFEAVGKDFDF